MAVARMCRLRGSDGHVTQPPHTNRAGYPFTAPSCMTQAATTSTRASPFLRWCPVRLPVMAALAALCLAACGNPPYPRGSVDSLFPSGQGPALQHRGGGRPNAEPCARGGHIRVPNQGPHAVVCAWLTGRLESLAHYLQAPELSRFFQPRGGRPAWLCWLTRRRCHARSAGAGCAVVRADTPRRKSSCGGAFFGWPAGRLDGH